MPDRLDPRAILDRLIAFPTISRDSNLPLIDWVETYLSDHGIRCHRHWHESGEKAALFAHVGPEAEGGVILSGHTDVVPVEGQVWASDPFALTERDGRLFGRGTADMKGFDALAIWALVEAGARGLSRPLQIALSYDEEIGCIGAPPLIDAMKTLPRARDVIVGEPTMLGVVTAHKGGLLYRVTVRGHEVHSSVLHRGVSAIMWGAKLIEWANGVNASQAETVPSGLAAGFDPPYTNVHVGQIEGGTAHNITARDCRFGLGFRMVPGETLEMWRSRALEAAAGISAEMQRVRPETGITLEEASSLPPFAPTKDNSAEALARALTGDNAERFVSFGTEASHFQSAGYHVAVCGPGSIEVAHQPDEHITLAQFDAGRRFMERLLERLA